MLKFLLTTILSIGLVYSAQAELRYTPLQQPPIEIPKIAPIKNAGLFVGLQATGVALEIIGVTSIATATRLEFDNLFSDKNPNVQPLYAAGATMVMVGVCLNVLANVKLYPHGWKTTPKGISYTIPRTNKHFGM
jgi:hypothetical protein